MAGIEQVFGAVGAIAVTASDSADFHIAPARGLLVATTGNYKVTMQDGSTPTLYLAGGIIHPLRCKRVWSTGAASTSGIVAFV
jgi:hypothetical protein